MRKAYQAHKNTKSAFTAGVLALLMGTGIGVSVKQCSKNTKEIQKPEHTITDVQNNSSLILTEDFDINNAESVKRRALEIYNISDKKISVDEIVNLIYYFNGKYDKLTFDSSLSKEQIFKKLQNYGLEIYSLLFQNITDDVNAMEVITSNVKNEEYKINEDSEIFAYMFMSNGKDQKNSSKYVAINYAQIVNKQLEDIKNKNVNNFEKNADDFYSIVKLIKDSKTFQDGHMILLIDDSKSKYPLFGNNLTKEETKYLREEAQNNYLNIVGFAAAKYLGVSTNEFNNCDDKVNSEQYVASDAKVASSVSGSKNDGKKTVVDAGGKKVSSGSKVIKSEGTTKVETYSYVVDVPTKTYTEDITGGEIVSEKFIDSDSEDAKKYLDEETTTTKDQQKILVDAGGKKIN